VAAEQDFPISRHSDVTVVIDLRPPAPVGGLDVRMTVADSFGSTSGRFVKYMNSGFYGVSGLTIVNSGAGVIAATIRAVDTSGLDWGNYAYEVKRFESGTETPWTQGYLILRPSMG
jgi:hypothetical protein